MVSIRHLALKLHSTRQASTLSFQASPFIITGPSSESWYIEDDQSSAQMICLDHDQAADNDGSTSHEEDELVV